MPTRHKARIPTEEIVFSPLTQREKKKLNQLYTEETHSVKTLCEVFDLAPASIYWHLRYPKHGFAWTNSENQTLITLYESNPDTRKISEELGRTERACELQLQALGVIKHRI